MAREVDYLPWTGQPFSYRKQSEQKEHHAYLLAHNGAEIDPAAFVSPQARVLADGLKIGVRSYIAAGVLVRGTIAMGRDCTVNAYANLHGKVTMGNGVRIASLATLAGEHQVFTDLTKLNHEQPMRVTGIVIGDDVWVGANVVVLDGVTVGAHTILAAGAVVTQDVPEYSIVGGNPGRVLRDRRAPAKTKSTQSADQAKGFGAKMRARGWGALKRRLGRVLKLVRARLLCNFFGTSMAVQASSNDAHSDPKEWHAYLRLHHGAEIDPAAVISPQARVFTEALKIGARSHLAADALVRGTITMGRDCTVESYVSLHGKVTMGDGVRLSSFATIAGQNHVFSDLTKPIYEQPVSFLGIVIGDDVWVGANVVVLDGVTVGAHSILEPGAIVTKDVPEYSIVGGNPARVLRDRRTPA
jgi:acetyltransferase-like isoleucine patch superfamily enzyme